jgi:hypothetical protein
MQKSSIKRATLRSERWEVGGEFHWTGLPPAPFIPWPEAASWYLLGRHALVALLQSLPPGPRRLWVPSYFCFDVSDYWRSFVELTTYQDDPRRAEPEWSTLQPEATDVVVAVNYFGVRSGEAWRTWRERNPCLLVEDHSHDPVSGWALESTAGYAFASLRKTLPVPDGAILWSPRGLPLPATGNSESVASALKLAAMLWKREYLLGGATPDAKSTYRAWQQEGERGFDESPVSFASNLSRKYLSYGSPLKWRKRRVANTKSLISKLQGFGGFCPIFSDWPHQSAPLCAVFEFDSTRQRDATRQRLQQHGIYCPVHWPATGGCDPAARDLAGRLLTIPTDQRYTTRDMEKIAAFATGDAEGEGIEIW